MMRQANLCLGLIFLALFKVATFTHVCKPQGYDCTNAACVSCPPAFGVKESCHEDTPTVCEPCVAEVNYSTSWSPFEPCKRVAECAADHIVAKKATRTSDRQCVCPKGYVEDRLGICHKLQPTQYLTASPTTSTTEVPTGSATSTMSFVKYIIIGSAGFIILCIGVLLVSICIYRCCKVRRLPRSEFAPLIPTMGNVQNASVGLQYTLRADIPFSYLPWKTYNWTKNDIPLKQSSRVTINNTSVTFIDVQPDAAGEYCCRNKSGEPQKTIQFVVKENLLPNYRVDEGMPLVLKYVIHAADMCSDWSYQWFCDGVQLRSASRDWSGENVTKLAIYRVSGRKKYWCVAKSDEWRLKLQSATAVVTCSGIRSSTTDFTPTDCTPTKDALPNRDGNDIGGTTDLETKLEDDMGQETGAASARGRDIIQATEDHPQHFLEQVVHSSEKNDDTTGHVVQGKLFSCVKHLTAEILHQLAEDIGGPNNDLSSVLAIAESIGVDVEEVKHRATMSSKDLSLFVLERLREINPDYPLSALCHIFVENDRPECAVELTNRVRRAGGILRLPDRLQKQLFKSDRWDGIARVS